ncbi:PepSY domain-containing protein [Tenacibaculum sp. SG-28]|uniref:PepSY domain-containing protein n=1 Tax=Tenacibaculum sp. SG-28 TaxID=754426 RepID=UPI000CF4FFCD|nr:PepSY domain-containing protein [Tenacibaculum sp. SG-28]
MTLSIWRYSHLTLAISSFLFITIAAITGIILALEPISKEVSPYAIDNLETITIGETIAKLEKNYDEIITLELAKNNTVKASAVDANEGNTSFYINPFTGEKIGELEKRKSIFKFATTLHRSLFLKSTGRIIVGVVSFLLLLLTCTGFMLICKRQGGIRYLFSTVVKEKNEQYYHVTIGRITSIPIVILTVTGIYLSLDKFAVLPKDQKRHKIVTKTPPSSSDKQRKDFTIFQTTAMQQLQRLEFPFSEDPEDYFTLKLRDKEVLIQQNSGIEISSLPKTTIEKLIDWSFVLHTGDGTLVWALILLLSCFAILYFIYSGFVMTIDRIKKRVSIKNTYSKEEANYILLVGSETGSTFTFAKSLYNALIATEQKPFMDSLNNYTTYKTAKYVFVLTATYGDGDAPSNANTAIEKMNLVPQNHTIKFAVVGFGSLAYPKYCAFALEIDNVLAKNKNFSRILPLHKVNNQSFASFTAWNTAINTATDTTFTVQPMVEKKPKEYSFKVVSKTEINTDKSFIIRFKPERKLKFQSGDLLGIRPKKDGVERLYSIAKIGKDILLSIKKHEYGICSTYLSELQKSSSVKAYIKKNTAFHFPQNSKEVILISNGTGIALLLMIHAAKPSTKIHLFWGGRTKESFNLYRETIEKALEIQQLNSLHIAYSRENAKKEYVQDSVLKNKDLIISTLQKKGNIMICGSVKMQNEILKVLHEITTKELNTSIESLQKNNKILTDCY